MADISGLYPQPYQPQPSALDDPQRVIGLINAMQELRSKQAIGNAFQQGDLNDPAAIWKNIQSNPDAARGAPEAYGSVLAAIGKKTENARRAMALGMTGNAEQQRLMAAMAQGGPVTDERIDNWATAAARAGQPTDQINDQRRYLKSLPVNQRTGPIADATRATMGAGAAADLQNVPGLTPAQPPTLHPLGEFVGQPGIAAGMSGQAGADFTALTGDQDRSRALQANMRNMKEALELARPLSVGKFGPESAGWTTWLARASRLGLVSADTNDEVSARQQLGAKLQAYVSQHPSAARSDSSLHNVMESKPNPDEMIKPATLEAIRSQLGKDVVDAAMPEIHQRGLAASVTGQEPSSYTSYRGNYYNGMDDRAAEWDFMSKPEKQKFVDSLGEENTAEYKKFVRTHNALRRAGYAGQ